MTYYIRRLTSFVAADCHVTLRVLTKDSQRPTLSFATKIKALSLFVPEIQPFYMYHTSCDVIYAWRVVIWPWLVLPNDSPYRDLSFGTKLEVLLQLFLGVYTRKLDLDNFCLGTTSEIHTPGLTFRVRLGLGWGLGADLLTYPSITLTLLRFFPKPEYPTLTP